MPEYEVLAAQHKRDLPAKDGYRATQVVALRLSDGTREHEAEWFTATTTDADALEGTRLSGTLSPSKTPKFPGLVFKKDNPNAGGAPRGRDPKDTAAMSRSAAQDRALAYMLVKATMGRITGDFKPDALVPLIEWFQNDVKRYQDRDEPPTVRGLPVRNAPQRTGAPEPTTPSPPVLPDVDSLDDDLPFEAA
jgi:hypothetical protein